MNCPTDPTAGGRRHSQPLRVVVAGLGRLGAALCDAARLDPEIELVGLASSRGAAATADLGAPADGLPVVTLEAALERPDVDCVLHGGSGDARALADLFEQCARAGRDVVSSAALLHPASELGAGAAARLDSIATENGVRLLATGVNPGFLLDVLPAACGVLAPGWTRLSAQRTVEAGHWGSRSLEFLGIGGPPLALERAVPLSLAPSLRILAEMLAVEPIELEEKRTAVTAAEDPERSIGFVQRVSARDGEGRRIELVWHAVVGLESEPADAEGGVVIEIEGENPLRLEMAGAYSADPYPATAVRMVRSAISMRPLAPGLLTVACVPLGRR